MTALELELDAVAWPLERCGEALDGLARAHGLLGDGAQELPRPAALSPDELPAWIDQCAEALGIEAEPIFVDYGALRGIIRSAGPVLLVVPVDASAGPEVCLAILAAEHGRARLLTPELGVRSVAVEALFRTLVSALEASAARELDEPLAALALPAARRSALLAGLVAERLGTHRLGRGWLVRSPPQGRWWPEVRRSGLVREAVLFFGAHLLQHGVAVLAWWIIGVAAMRGTLGSGWSSAWLLLVVALVLLQVAASWLSALLAIDGGLVLKRRLLAGALASELESVRRRGVGEAFGSIHEAESIDRMARVGGLMGLMSLAELVVAGLVLAGGRSGGTSIVLLAGWLGLTVWLVHRCAVRHLAWASDRVGMTHELVEAMIGQRTRLAQADATRWHVQEDRRLARYLERGTALDRATSALVVLVPRGWVLTAMLGLMPALVLDDVMDLESTALALGGILLAHRALGHMVASVHPLMGAVDAWRRCRPLFQLATARARAGAPRRDEADAHHRGPLLSVRELAFVRPGRAEPVLQGCELQMHAGERILLEGGSGSGKSTLAALVAGLEDPSAGLLLLHGRDLRSTGSAWWRRRVVLVPQFHDNHLLNGSLALNLLCGTDWPAGGRHMQQAQALCEELGLGPLLERMPMGLQQVVGETGWQLSHGERSRVYIARALLQDPDLVVLDESFAALDPHTLALALACVRRRARTLLVIAHP